MTLEAAAVILLLHLQPHPEDAGEVGRVERITILGLATAHAAQRATCRGAYAVKGCRPIYGDAYGLVAAMVALGEHESGFRYRIQAGQCLPHECDSVRVNGNVVFMAQGPWQAHKLERTPLEEWQSMVGVDAEATAKIAWYSTKLFASYENHCRRGAPGGFAGYATGKYCFWEGESALVQKSERYRRFLVRVATQA